MPIAHHPKCVAVLALLGALATFPAEAAGGFEAPAIIKADEKVELTAQIAARITAMPLKPGQRFTAGDLLVAFDCARHQAELDEARANAKAAASKHRMNRSMDAYGAIGKNEVRISAAQSLAAEAKARSQAETVKHCRIEAPYSGRVAATETTPHAAAEPGSALLSVIRDDALTVEFIAPSIWLRWMEPGQVLQVEVRETEDVLPATIERVGAVVDPVSRTVTVYARFDALPGSVLSGMSGRVMLAGPAS